MRKYASQFIHRLRSTRDRLLEIMLLSLYGGGRLHGALVASLWLGGIAASSGGLTQNATDSRREVEQCGIDALPLRVSQDSVGRVWLGSPIGVLRRYCPGAR